VQTLLQNLSYTLRLIRKNPGLTLTVLLTLALGIGANTAIFTVDYATLLAPLPYPQADQLVIVWSKIRAHRNSISASGFPRLEAAEQRIPGPACLDGRLLQRCYARATGEHGRQDHHAGPLPDVGVFFFSWP
jgi:hypothetical protein